MQITALPTPPITPSLMTVERLVDRYAINLPPRSVLAISSKVVSLCEGNVILARGTDRQQLIREESDYYREPIANSHHFTVTIKSNILIGAAGVDRSFGRYIPWPSNPQATCNKIRQRLSAKAKAPMGVIITDSKSVPSQRGTTGFALAHSGFNALKNYIGKSDVFSDRIFFKVANVANSLAAAATCVMGDGDECTPLAAIQELPNIEFQDRNPTLSELSLLQIPPHDDLFSELLLGVSWDKYPT